MTQSGETNSLWHEFKEHGLELSVAIAGVLILLFLASATFKPRVLAERVLNGGEVRPISNTDRVGWWFDAIWKNPLRIRVERTRVWPASPRAGLPEQLRGGRTFAYLGRNADTIILFDRAHGGRTLRVPAALVVLSDADG
jgi:hypothetical protein